MRRTIHAVLVTALMFQATPPVRAGAQRPIDDPAVFPGAAVNSFVLPYRYVGDTPTPELASASRHIAALVHFEILFAMLKYGTVGGVDLVDSKNTQYDVNRIIDRVSLGTPPNGLRKGQTLVVTWGRLFEQGDQLYLQSYVRFLREGDGKPEREAIRVSLGPEDARLELSGGLPNQAVAFPPRRIGRDDLARVTAEFKKTMVVRPTPDLNVPGVSIDFDPDIAFLHGVTKIQGDWMWIDPFHEGPRGWVRAHTGTAEDPWSLTRWLPELSYVDAICGFMRLRAGDAVGDASERAKIIAAIETGFSRYAAAVPAEDAPEADGVAQAIRGFLAWDTDPSPTGRAKAADLFAQARKRMPEYADAVNLAVVTTPLQGGAAFDARAVQGLAHGLTGALALDSSNATVRDNLDRVFGLLAIKRKWSDYSRKQINQRRAILGAPGTTRLK